MHKMWCLTNMENCEPEFWKTHMFHWALCKGQWRIRNQWQERLGAAGLQLRWLCWTIFSSLCCRPCPSLGLILVKVEIVSTYLMCPPMHWKHALIYDFGSVNVNTSWNCCHIGKWIWKMNLNLCSQAMAIHTSLQNILSLVLR